MKVYSNLKHYTLDQKEKRIEDLPFEWDKVSNIPDIAFKNGYHAVLVYAYIHSGISFSLSDYKDPWDSGIAGVLLFPKTAKRVRAKAEAFVRKRNELEVCYG